MAKDPCLAALDDGRLCTRQAPHDGLTHFFSPLKYATQHDPLPDGAQVVASAQQWETRDHNLEDDRCWCNPLVIDVPGASR